MHAEQQLLHLLQTDANAGLAAALATYGGTVKRIVHRVLRESAQDAEECMADAFVSLWRHAAAVQTSGAPIKAWLVVTARNAAISRLRRSTPEKQALPLDESLCAADEAWLYEQGGAQEAVQQMVTALQPPDKEIFVRKYYYLQSAEEIAAALSLSPDAVYARLSRGRQKMKQQLLQGGYVG